MIQHFGKEKPYPGPEDQFQIATARIIRLHPAKPLAYHIPNGGKRPLTPVRNRRTGVVTMAPVIGRKLKEQGALAGVPDWYIAEPRGAYPGAYIELKVKGGTMQPSQVAFLEAAAMRGYYVAVVWSLESFKERLDWYLNLKNNSNEKGL